MFQVVLNNFHKTGLWLGMLLAVGVVISGCVAFNPVGLPQGEGSPTVEAGLDARPSATSLPAVIQTPPPAPTPTREFHALAVHAPDCSYGGTFQAIEAVDASTIRFSLCRPDPAFLSKIAFPAFAIYSQEWLAGLGSPGFSIDAPVGSGPFRLVEWQRGEKMVLAAFEAGYRPGAPILRDLEFRWERDGSLRLVELQTHVADGIDDVNAGDFPVVRSDPSQVLLVRPPLSVAYLGMNNLHPPFDDERVRRAIALGIDREKLLAEAFPEGYEAARYFTPCIIPGGCSGEGFGEFDLPAAQALLAEAGYAAGFQTELVYRDVVRGYLPWPVQVAQNLQAQLRENLKIQARLETLDDETFYTTLDAGGLPGLYLLGWGADYPHSDNFLVPHFGPDATLQFGNPSDDLAARVLQAATTADENERLTLAAAANTALWRQVPMVPLSHGGWISPNGRALALAAEVQGAHASPIGVEDFSTLALPNKTGFTWIQALEPLTLYCALAEDADTLRACAALADTLYRYAPGGVTPEPGLAQACIADDALRTWICELHANILFQDGSSLDANDVVASFRAQWDARSAAHALEKGEFYYFEQFWPGFLNEVTP